MIGLYKGLSNQEKQNSAEFPEISVSFRSISAASQARLPVHIVCVCV